MNPDIASQNSGLTAEIPAETPAKPPTETTAAEANKSHQNRLDNISDQTGKSSDDHHLASVLAKRAGELLMDLRSKTTEIIATEYLASKSQASKNVESTNSENVAFWNTHFAILADLKAKGDRLSHEFLVAELQAARPHDIVLSEEGRNDPRRLTAERVWILDPLDGTREFGDPPRDDWAVHVALLEDGELAAGAVALPARGITLSTAGPPALPPVAKPNIPRVIASRSRPGPVPHAIAELLNGELLCLGSAGAKAMSVVLGEADIYAHTGGQYEWDSAAPVAVARAAGCHTSRIDGSPLRYNQPNVYLPDLLICRPEWATQALAVAALCVL